MNPLNAFDFSAVRDVSFKEDSVREEILAPILRALGYRPTGAVRVERSKSLVHPFVMLGSRRHPANLIPDYTLYVDDRAVMVLDAKEPSASITKSQYVEQAYSYAIHPDVRCERYGLCNGRKLVTFNVAGWSPDDEITLDAGEECWESLRSALSPAKLKPAIHDGYTTWFQLVGVLMSPASPSDIAGNAAYRLSWYMPSVSSSLQAAVKAAMSHLSDSELLAILRAADYLFQQLDGSPADHVGYLLSYDGGMSDKLKALLDAKKIPPELAVVTSQLVDFLAGGD